MERSWDINVRLLHWTIAVVVTFQQFSSIWMSDQGTQYLFPYHRIAGALAAIVALLFWLYSYAIYDLKYLFPWGQTARREVVREARALFRGRLPASGRGIGLSGFFHGLGLLALSGCGLTGVIMFAMIPPGHIGPPDDPIAFTHYTLMHKYFGQALWLYWFGHVGFALIHQFAGDNVLRAIFGLGHSPEDDKSET